MKFLSTTAFVLCVILTHPACQSPLSSPPGFQVGLRPLKTDPEKVTQLVLSRNNPASGEHWTATFGRRENSPGHSFWTIDSAPGGQILVDRLANTNFLNHLLETLSTLELMERLDGAKPEKYRLDIPLWAFRLKTGDSETEIRFGERHQEDRAVYATFSQNKDMVWIAQGATLAMLDFVKSFQFLRHPTLATLTKDEVTDIQILSSRNKKLFHATRMSGRWADSKSKFLNVDVDGWLQAILALRIKEFIDDPVRAKVVFDQSGKSFQKQVVLTNRKGKSVTLTLVTSKDLTYATTSTRQNAAFTILREGRRLFEPPHSPVYD